MSLLLLTASARPQASGASGASASRTSAASLRIGVYDSRAVAVAYVRSAESAKAMQALLAERDAAKKAGDSKRIKELNAQGESLQIRRHLQGFSNAPVDDILDTIRDQLSGVADRANVGAIVSAAAWHDGSVELVDVTDDMVQLFKPDGQTLEIVAEMRKQSPIAIEDAARIPAKN